MAIITANTLSLLVILNLKLEKAEQIAKLEQDHETAIREAAAAVYAGGADTTVTALIVFMLAMMKFPHVQKKAQAEIDAAIVGYRFPTLTTGNKLPYGLETEH
ncbi:hypothetical protein TMatcc_003140 [Talaromyces marneffei ATCC 18224]